MLQACLNGGVSFAQHPSVPITSDALAAEALAVRAAGADELHVHARGPDGAETLEPSAVSEALRAIRRAVPGMPIGLGTGYWIAPGGRARHALMRAWTDAPDYVSVNLHEEDAPEVIEFLTGAGVGVEAGIWNVGAAERFLAEIDPARCLRVLVEMLDDDEEVAVSQAHAVMQVLAKAERRPPILLHGCDGAAWACVREAWRLGLSTRIGFEDTLRLPDGAIARGNADLVRAALALKT